MPTASNGSAARGLRWEILVSLGMIMLGGVAFMGATALKAAERAIVMQRMESLSQVSRSIQMNLSLILAAREGDAGDLQGQLEKTFRAMGVASLMVTDGTGRVMAAVPSEQIGQVSTDPHLQRALAVGRMVLPTELSGSRALAGRGLWTFAGPVYSGDGPVGAFAAVFPLENLGVALGVHRKIVFTFALLDALVILLFGIWLIGRTAVNPIVRIARGARELAEGNYDARVEVSGPREIASLADSFNEMADRVQSAVRKQEEHMRALEGANRQLRAAQVEMLRIEKMASVGRLSAGIAHEIGNPLSAILGYSSILLADLGDSEAGAYLRYIESETERIQRIIRGLLDFARPREAQFASTDVNELVRFTLELVSPQKDFTGVEVELSLAPDLPSVRGDRHQLQQALINVLLNGAQAMGGRGRLRVATSSRRLTSEEVSVPRRRASDLAGADYASLRHGGQEALVLSEGDLAVSISVRDEGPGIPEEIRDRIFDPFFTTRDPGEGTGLGLSITYGIVQAHGGRIEVRTGSGKGTEMVLELPAEKEAS